MLEAFGNVKMKNVSGGTGGMVFGKYTERGGWMIFCHRVYIEDGEGKIGVVTQRRKEVSQSVTEVGNGMQR